MLSLNYEFSLLYRSRNGLASHLWAWVSEIEVEELMWKPGEDRSGRDDSRIAIGQTQAGRYLRVIYVPDTGTDGIFVITAYELTGKPLTAYRRRKRRK
jgi:hypothetical protein